MGSRLHSVWYLVLGVLLGLVGGWMMFGTEGKSTDESASTELLTSRENDQQLADGNARANLEPTVLRVKNNAPLAQDERRTEPDGQRSGQPSTELGRHPVVDSSSAPRAMVSEYQRVAGSADLPKRYVEYAKQVIRQSIRNIERSEGFQAAKHEASIAKLGEYSTGPATMTWRLQCSRSAGAQIDLTQATQGSTSKRDLDDDLGRSASVQAKAIPPGHAFFVDLVTVKTDPGMGVLGLEIDGLAATQSFRDGISVGPGSSIVLEGLGIVSYGQERRIKVSIDGGAATLVFSGQIKPIVPGDSVRTKAFAITSAEGGGFARAGPLTLRLQVDSGTSSGNAASVDLDTRQLTRPQHPLSNGPHDIRVAGLRRVWATRVFLAPEHQFVVKEVRIAFWKSSKRGRVEVPRFIEDFPFDSVDSGTFTYSGRYQARPSRMDEFKLRVFDARAELELIGEVVPSSKRGVGGSSWTLTEWNSPDVYDEGDCELLVQAVLPRNRAKFQIEDALKRRGNSPSEHVLSPAFVDESNSGLPTFFVRGAKSMPPGFEFHPMQIRYRWVGGSKSSRTQRLSASVAVRGKQLDLARKIDIERGTQFTRSLDTDESAALNNVLSDIRFKLDGRGFHEFLIVGRVQRVPKRR